MSKANILVYSTLWLAFLWLQVALFSPEPQASTLVIDPPSRLLQKTERTPGDAQFNNIDVYYREGSPRPSFHCVGRDLHDPVLDANYSWMFRSCHYQHLCLNTETKEFILPSTPSQPVALGAINPRWSGRGFNKGFHKVQWTPRTDAEVKGYYELPKNVVMVPFHSMAAHNVGHLLWDDFYPLFTLLHMFGLVSDHQHLLLRWAPKKALYASCDIRPNKRKQCQANFERFLPLLGVDPTTFSAVSKAVLQPRRQPLKSMYVCAAHAVAGMGMLMDHGTRDHGTFVDTFLGDTFVHTVYSKPLLSPGWTLRNPDSGIDLVPHNLGRGAIFRDFRDFMVNNLGVPSPPRPNKITFSTHSSRGFERSLGFETQIAAIKRALPVSLEVQNVTLKDLSLPEQMRVALESAVFVTVCGGGAVTATFLPPGSTLIVYYPEDGGFDFWNYNYTYNLPQYNYQRQPARLDWDLLSNAAHLKVHWLPLKTMEEDVKVLEQLILHDLEGLGLLSSSI